MRISSIGGTYQNGSETIPSNTGIVTIAGKWTFPGGVAYLSATDAAGTAYVNPLGTDSVVGDGDYPGYWSDGYGKSAIDFSLRRRPPSRPLARA